MPTLPTPSWLLAALAASVCLWSSAAATAATLVASVDTPAFSYNANSFLLHGEPYVMIGGQMDPQRVPPDYWRDRLAKARAMGLNTIFSYVYWNMLEPRADGRWMGGNGSGVNDIARFFRLAQAEGLHVVLRPGPYICGEREWGGFPAWLAQVPDMTVRSSNAAFMAAAVRYLQRLAADLRDTQVTRGGPLLMVQVENEYGSYGSDHNYTYGLRDALRDVYEVPLYTNDGGVDWTLAGGSVPGALAATDGDPAGGFRAREQYVRDASMLGPLLDGEYYTLAPDFWGPHQPHNVAGARSSQAAQFMRDLDFVLRANNSISLYMFHGGTNFGLSNGAMWRNYTAPFTTSYDYGAPLDESGRTTDLYRVLRRTILRYVPARSVPTPPANVPRMALPAVILTPYAELLTDLVPANSTSEYGDSDNDANVLPGPLTMEALGQAYGLVLYEHRVRAADASLHGVLRVGDRARDRVIVYVNGARVGVIDSTYTSPASVSVTLRLGDHLQLLVENLGRADYWSQESRTPNVLLDQAKGICGDVVVGSTVVHGWVSKALPLDDVPALRNTSNTTDTASMVGAGTTALGGPILYRGRFTVDSPTDGDVARLDTYLAVPAGIKGVVWVNGFNLGRYWIVGPQQSLYLPGPILKAGNGQVNEIVVLELEPKDPQTSLAAVGQAERVWTNHPDPDEP